MNEKIFQQLLDDIKKVINENTNAIKRNFEIGKLIINNQDNYPSKEELLEKLSKELGKGYAKANLSDMRRLYDVYKDNPQQFELAQKIGWSHNRILLKIENDSELREELFKFAINTKAGAELLDKELIDRRGRKEMDSKGFKIKIERIEIKNFKSIVNLKIERPNPFTVFVGSNACGKSNIFSAIDMLFNSYYNSPLKSFNDFGGEHLFNFYKKDTNIEITLQTTIGENLAFINDIQEGSVNRNEIKEPYNKKLVNQFSYLFIKEGIKASNKTSILEKDGSNYKTVLREKILSDVPTKEAFIRKLKKAVPEVMEVNIDKSEIDGKDELFIKDGNYPDIKIPETLISDGTQKMIILLTAILQSKEPQFICIEEPENGIHPIVLELFIDTIRNICEDEGHYIWFTTHSPTIIRHLNRSELIIVDKKDGQTKIKKASDNVFDDYFSGENLSLDDAWLTDIFEGGLPW